MATTAPTMSKISKAKARLLMDHPFFATLLIRTQVIITDNAHGQHVETAATDGTNIYFNPTLLEQSTVDEVMSDLAHEVCHDSFMHSIRLGQRNPKLANIAMDLAINPILENQGFKPPKGGWLCEAKYKGWNWERIYDDLRRMQQAQPQPKPGQGKPGPGQPGQSGPPSQGQGQPQPSQTGQFGAPRKATLEEIVASISDGTKPDGMRLGYDVIQGPAKSPAEQAQAEQRAKQKIAAAATMAKMAGKLTGDLARMVGDLLANKVHWTAVLRDKMMKVVKSRDSWVRRNKRFTKIWLPTRHERKMGPIIFIPDTSGSMWGDDMEKICSEMSHCADQTKPEHIRVVWADTSVKGEQVFEASEFSFKALKPKGGGGTDMTKPLKYVEKYEPQVVVLMTDGYTPWPKGEPPFPLIVICTTDVEVPVGEVIRI